MGSELAAAGSQQQTETHLNIMDALEVAKDAANGLEMTLDVAIEDDPEGLQDLHDDVIAVTDVLKNDLATLLMLQVPSEAAGDND